MRGEVLLCGRGLDESATFFSSQGVASEYIQDEHGPLPDHPGRFTVVVCNSLFQRVDIDHFPNVEFIQLTSSGLDRVPLARVRERGIVLQSATKVYGVPVAEWVLCRVLDLLKASHVFYQAQQEHRWEKLRDLGELSGKRALIVGAGSVGTNVAKRLKAFDVEVNGVARSRSARPYFDTVYTLSDLSDVLPRTDILILTVPLSEDTRGLIDRRRLLALPAGSIVVNASRGAVLDEEALTEALQAGHLLGAALDVFQTEPLPRTSPLWNVPNVLITPHNAFASNEVPGRLNRLVCANVMSFLRTVP